MRSKGMAFGSKESSRAEDELGLRLLVGSGAEVGEGRKTDESWSAESGRSGLVWKRNHATKAPMRRERSEMRKRGFILDNVIDKTEKSERGCAIFFQDFKTHSYSAVIWSLRLVWRFWGRTFQV